MSLYCQLSLNVAARVEAELVDVLQHYPAWVSGYTAVHAAGYGQHDQLYSPIERVRGAANRRVIQLICALEHVPLILQALQQQFAQADVFYWTTPVLEAGHLQQFVGAST